MKRLVLCAVFSLFTVGFLSAHPHEWVDFGAGVEFKDPGPGKPLTVTSVIMELTWDEYYSALVLTDFPQLKSDKMTPADLKALDDTYGLNGSSSVNKMVFLWNGSPLPLGKPVALKPTTDGKTVTFVYRVRVGKVLSSPTELRVTVYDPTYYTDMGIRSKNPAYFVGGDDSTAAPNFAFFFEQDKKNAYYEGQVYPEVIVFTLKPKT